MLFKTRNKFFLGVGHFPLICPPDWCSSRGEIADFRLHCVSWSFHERNKSTSPPAHFMTGPLFGQFCFTPKKVLRWVPLTLSCFVRIRAVGIPPTFYPFPCSPPVLNSASECERISPLVIYTITERVHNFVHLWSSNDAASVHSIVHAHVPRGLLGSLKVWALDACGRRSSEQFSDFLVFFYGITVIKS